MTMPFVVDPLLTQYQRNGYNYGNPMMQGYANPVQNPFLAQNNPSALLAGSAQTSSQPPQQYEIVQDEAGNRYAAVQTVEDGKDDGKISLWSKIKNFGKGCLKFVTGMFTDEKGDFSIWQTLKSVGIITAAVAVSIASYGTAAAPALAAAGVALGVTTGGYKVVKGAINASKAKTDAEAEAAWQDIGLGATTVGVSVAGAKGAMSSVNGTAYQGNCLKATVDCFSTTGKNIANLASSAKASYQAGTLMADASAVWSAAKTNFVTNSRAMFGSSKAFANFQQQEIAKIDEQIANLDKVKDADQYISLLGRKNSLSSQLASIDNARTTDDVASIVQAAEDELQTLKLTHAPKAQIAAAKSQLNSLKTAGNIKIAQLKEVIISADRAAGVESQVAVTAREGKDVLLNAYVTPVKPAIIGNIKYNPFIGRNVDESGTQVINYYAIQ